MAGTRAIYIVLTDTQTWLSRAIGWYTGETLNHASIAFDSRLEEVYSFGRKLPHNPFIGGFVRERMNSEWFLDERRAASCAIYQVMVSHEEYVRIRGYIREIEVAGDRYSFNLLGLIGVAANVKIERRRSLFCSQFVANALLAGGVRLTDKPTCLTTPQDLIASDLVQPIYRGALSRYFERIGSPMSAQLCYNRMEYIS